MLRVSEKSEGGGDQESTRREAPTPDAYKEEGEVKGGGSWGKAATGDRFRTRQGPNRPKHANTEQGGGRSRGGERTE